MHTKLSVRASGGRKALGNVIALEINLKSCLGFADRFIKEEKYLDAMVNLNEAIQFVENKEEKREILVRFLFLLTQTDNFGSAYTVLCKLIYTYCMKDTYIFDGVDLVLKESLLFSSQDEMFFFEGLDIKAREDFITVREYCKNENYEALFDAMPLLVNPQNPHFPEMMKLIYETTQQEDFKVNKDKVLKSAMLLYPNAPENPYVISLLLDTNDKDILDILEKGYRMQLERANDNYFDLLRIGRAYMLNGRYWVASKFFTRLMYQNKYDEETLWMTALNYYLLGEKEKGRRYLNTYAAFFHCSEAPIGIYRAYMDGEEVLPVRYPFVSHNFIKAEIARLKHYFAHFPASDITLKALEDLYKVAGFNYHELYEIVAEYPSEAMQLSIKRMLSSMRVNSYHKLYLFNELVQSDYEGSVDMIYKDRIYCGNILRLRARGIDKRYFRFYKEIIALMPFCEEVIPLKCNELSEIVKKVAKEFPLDETEEREGIAKYLIFTLYCKKLKIKIEKDYFQHIFNTTDSEDFEEMCAPFLDEK